MGKYGREKKPELSKNLIKKAIRKRLAEGAAARQAVEAFIRKQYPNNTLTTSNFYAALREMRRSKELLDTPGPLRLNKN